MGTSLQDKTIRPGSMLGYSYYHSSRSAYAHTHNPAKPKKSRQKMSLPTRKVFIYLAILLGVLIALNFAGHFTNPKPSASTPVISPPVTKPKTQTQPTASTSCTGNTDAKHIFVSVSQRKLFACQQTKQVYVSPVVTGISYLQADITPIGTYSIYGKYTNTVLTGSDTTGSWNDHVNYWLPFLQNQFGIYGLHDATWRNNSDFGNISPNSPNASHGCVELPLDTAKWVYNWVDVGTQVTINS
ncbi:MAG: L,D-transpeptidase [Candidatus Saccharimonadales bacterium]